MEENTIIKYVNDQNQEKTLIVNEKLGEGSYGQVFKCFLSGYGFVALKVQKLEYVRTSLEIEIKIAKSLADSKTAIVLRKIIYNTSEGTMSEFKALSDSIEKGTVCSIYDLADGLELYNYITYNRETGTELGYREIQKYARDLLNCLSDLDTARIAHRDLKPSNLILNKGTITMIDFGFACFLGECIDQIGTPVFLPPEYFKPRGVEDWQKSDIFAMGLTLFSLITNGHLIIHLRTNEELKEFYRERSNRSIGNYFQSAVIHYARTYKMLYSFMKLILGMLEPVPQIRWTIKECYDWLDYDNGYD